MKYNTKSIQFKQDETQKETIIITAENEWYDVERIGRFNFYTKDGWLILQNGKKKEYKQWQSLFNNFFKMDEMFGWIDMDINKAMDYGIEKLKNERLEYENKLKAKQLDRAMDYMAKVKDGTIKITDEIISKTEKEIEEMVLRTFKNMLPRKIVNEVVKTIKNYENERNEKEIAYTVGNRSFNDYDNAVAYCMGCDWDTDMIVAG